MKKKVNEKTTYSFVVSFLKHHSMFTLKCFQNMSYFSRIRETRMCSCTSCILARARVVLRPHVNLSDFRASLKIRPFLFLFFKNLICCLKTLATLLYGTLSSVFYRMCEFCYLQIVKESCELRCMCHHRLIKKKRWWHGAGTRDWPSADKTDKEDEREEKGAQDVLTLWVYI